MIKFDYVVNERYQYGSSMLESCKQLRTLIFCFHAICPDLVACFLAAVVGSEPDALSAVPDLVLEGTSGGSADQLRTPPFNQKPLALATGTPFLAHCMLSDKIFSWAKGVILVQI